MKPRILLGLFAFVLATSFTGCPKKKSDGEAGVEQAEGSSSVDKSGDGASEEMQEKKGGSSSDAATPEGGSGGEAEKK